MPEQTANPASGRHLQLLIDAVIDYAIYMIGVDGRVLSWNSGAARLKGYTAEEIIGRRLVRPVAVDQVLAAEDIEGLA